MMSKKSPQLRFEGFTDDWEQRKLGELSQKISVGIATSSSKYFSSQDHGVPFIKNQDIKENRINTKNLEYISKEFDNKNKNKRVKQGDIITARTGYPGLSAVVPKELEGAQTFTTLITRPISEMILSEYISIFINSPYGMKQISGMEAGGAQKNVNAGIVQNLLIPLPSLDEQKKISNFILKLDDTIALHQRKLDLLKEQKKGYLQKMFPKNGAKVPELRFAGFADDWEDRKLSSIAERVTRKNKNNESTLPLTISAQDGLVDQNDYFNKQVASRDVTGYFLVKNGEFAYNKSYSNGYAWGAIKRLDKYEMGVLSTLYIVFKPTAINSQFLVSYYETTRWYREVSKNAAEGARNHGLLNISPNDFFNTLLTIPKSAEEQQQIGSFFKQLDDTIALHQRKLDLLKEQKKGFIKQMFV